MGRVLEKKKKEKKGGRNLSDAAREKDSRYVPKGEPRTEAVPFLKGEKKRKSP